MTVGSDPRLQLGPQVTGADTEACRDALDAVRPIVRIAPGAPSPVAHAAAALSQLLLRLHPAAALDGDAPLGPNPWGAATVAAAAAAAPTAEPTRAPARDLVIVFGDGADGDWFIGGDDWTAVLSTTPVAATPTSASLGLNAAAAFAAAEVLKLALGPLGLVTESALPALVWNLVDYRLRPAPVVELDWATPRSAALLGGGSVGSSGVGVLVGGVPITGNIDVVDGDSFDPARNPYRYPASTRSTSGPKAEWLAALLRTAGWQAVPHFGDVASWVVGRPSPSFDGVAVSSVDRVDSRVDVADALAATTISVGVSGLAFHVQREHTVDEFACPFCQFLHVARPMSQAQVYAEQVGVPVERVVALIQGAMLKPADVAAAVSSGRINAAGADELVGRRLEDLVRRAYAQATIPTRTGLVTVSAPAVSWLAGTIAAAELAKSGSRVEVPRLDRRIDIDLAGVPSGATRRVPRDRSGRCLCASPFRRRAAKPAA